MKTIISYLFFSLFGSFAYSQLTYIPDDAFEAYLENEIIGMSNGVPNDNYINTNGVQNCVGIEIFGNIYPVQDLTGIENLTYLKFISFNGIMMNSINLSTMLSNPYAFKMVNCPLLTTIQLPTSDSWSLLEFTSNNSLADIFFGPNSGLSGSQISSIVYISVQGNAQLRSFDISNLPMNSTGTLSVLNNPSLECLNLKNGACVLWTAVQIGANVALDCVQVDNPSYSAASPSWTNLNSGTTQGAYSTACSSCLVSLEEKKQNPLTVYPNPSNGQITLESSQHQDSDTYKILDQFGRLVQSGLLQSKETTIHLDIQKGIYYVIVGANVAKIQKI